MAVVIVPGPTRIIAQPGRTRGHKSAILRLIDGIHVGMAQVLLLEGDPRALLRVAVGVAV